MRLLYAKQPGFCLKKKNHVCEGSIFGAKIKYLSFFAQVKDKEILTFFLFLL